MIAGNCPGGCGGDGWDPLAAARGDVGPYGRFTRTGRCRTCLGGGKVPVARLRQWLFNHGVLR